MASFDFLAHGLKIDSKKLVFKPNFTLINYFYKVKHDT